VKQRSREIPKVETPAIIGENASLKEIIRHSDRGVMLNFLPHEAEVLSSARQINFDVTSRVDQIIMHFRLPSSYEGRFQSPHASRIESQHRRVVYMIGDGIAANRTIWF
jgi:hypothetical protein